MFVCRMGLCIYCLCVCLHIVGSFPNDSFRYNTPLECLSLEADSNMDTFRYSWFSDLLNGHIFFLEVNENELQSFRLRFSRDIFDNTSSYQELFRFPDE